MAELRFKGPKAGTAFNLSNATVDAVSGSSNVTSFLTPSALTGLPIAYNATTSGKQRDGETLSLQTTGLTGITAYQWQKSSDGSLWSNISGETSSTYLVDDAGDSVVENYVRCQLTCNEGVLSTPGVYIYDDHAMSSHNSMDDAVLALVAHERVTHVAIADGDWSNTDTWLNGLIPYYGARVLIPAGRSITYDVAANSPRLKTVRVDGTLTWAIDQSTQMLVDTMVITQEASAIIGTNVARVPAAYTAEIIISDRDYDTDSRISTDIDLTDDTTLIGRGILWHGTFSIWGAEKTSWLKTAVGSAPMSTDTSLTLASAPTGWEVGDEIVIGGTGYANTSYVSESEKKTITSVSSATIGWTGGLTYDHDHHNSSVDRDDLQPGVANLTRNVKIRSETSNVDPWRRGHCMAMHSKSRTDIWSCEFKDLGRTNKLGEGDENPSGIIDSNNKFKFSDPTVRTPNPPSAIRIDVDATTGVYTRQDGGDFVAEGFQVGQVVQMYNFANSGNNTDASDAGKVITAVNTNTITVDNTGLVTETGSGDEQIINRYTTETVTSQSNLQSRYPVHLHFVGFNKAVRDVVVDCAVNNSPGWAMVHHGCEADFRSNVMYEFNGAGMVGETGNEVGAWVDNLAVKSVNKDASSPKDFNSVYGIEGDFGRQGEGFLMRGRALRTNRNMAMDCSWGHVFYHRANTNTISNVIDYDRTILDLQDLQGLRTTTDMPVSDYPIIHASENEAAGCIGGLFVTKSQHPQHHGWNINIREFTSWGFASIGGGVEYVDQYALTGWDCVAHENHAAADGVFVGNNAYGIAIVRARTAGCRRGISVASEDLGGHNSALSPSGEPRYMVEAHESVGDTDDFWDENSPTETVHETDEVSYVEPSHNLPFIIADCDGASVTNEQSGVLTDTLVSLATCTGAINRVSTYNEDLGMVISGDQARVTSYLSDNGYWTNGGNNLAVFPLYFSDRLSAKPIKTYHAVKYTGSVASYTNNGAYTDSANAPSVSPATLTTMEGTSGDLNILALASDSDGDTPVLSTSFFAPDHGRLEINTPTAGEIRYTPDPGFEGTDTAFVWVEDDAGNATRVDVDIQVGVSTVTAVATGDWSFVDTGSDTLTFTLNDAPDSGNRRILKTEYSTNNGTNWRRLCYKWIPGTHTVSLESDGVTSVSSATNYSQVKIRYVTDLGDDTATESASKSE